jgi:hypothetical protein
MLLPLFSSTRFYFATFLSFISHAALLNPPLQLFETQHTLQRPHDTFYCGAAESPYIILLADSHLFHWPRPDTP